MTGFIKDESNKGIPGAIVRATHVPSGTVYGTATQNDGSFNIQNMRVGGPYKVEVSFLGYEAQTFSNIYLTLGETYELNGKMATEGQNLKEVAVRAHRDPILNNQRTGATSDIDATQISTLPSINRAVSDFTKLSPQSGASFSSGLNNGNSFAGRDGRYNNVQINGANFNNAFGLSNSLLPGGASQPIPLDAIDEIQIAIAPYDVRQSNFTGANINAVTRSGTNEFTGSVYTYWRNQNFNGVHVGDNTDLPAQVNTTDDVYSARLGGPIIKNKLFFFVNDEYEKSITPGLSPQYVANGSTGGTQTRVSADSLQMVSDFVKQKYGYNTGAYQGYYNQFTQEDNKFIARLDWNINSKNKADFSFSDLINHNPVTTNGTSAAGGSLSNQRIGPNSMSFANSIYGFKDQVKSFAGEVVSNFSSKVSNQVLATYTMVRDTRTSPSSPFPFIDIATGPSNYSDNQISLGYELFTYDNDVKNNTLSIYDNVTITQGKNNITAGADFQYLTFADGFVPYGTGYYRYASIQDFLSDAAPMAFGYTYPYQGGQGIYVQTNYGLAGVYGQDKINVTKHLTLTAGLRIDVPMYLNKLTANPYIDTLNLLNKNGGYTHYDVGKWPTSKPVLSPRIAFNWDPKGDRSIQVRGGTGIFMGQVGSVSV